MKRDPIKGDRIDHFGRKGTVTSIHFNYKGVRICEIEFDDPTKGSWYDEVMSDHLTVLGEPPPIPKTSRKKNVWLNSNEKCPFCETKWTLTNGFNKTIWKDCKPCGKTKEEIDKEV